MQHILAVFPRPIFQPLPISWQKDRKGVGLSLQNHPPLGTFKAVTYRRLCAICYSLDAKTTNVICFHSFCFHWGSNEFIPCWLNDHFPFTCWASSRSHKNTAEALYQNCLSCNSKIPLGIFIFRTLGRWILARARSALQMNLRKITCLPSSSSFPLWIFPPHWPKKCATYKKVTLPHYPDLQGKLKSVAILFSSKALLDFRLGKGQGGGLKPCNQWSPLYYTLKHVKEMDGFILSARIWEKRVMLALEEEACDLPPNKKGSWES